MNINEGYVEGMHLGSKEVLLPSPPNLLRRTSTSKSRSSKRNSTINHTHISMLA